MMKNRSHRITLIALFLLFSLLLFGQGAVIASITVDAASVLQDGNLSSVRMYAYPEGKGDIQPGSYYLTRMTEEDVLRLRTETGLDFLPILGIHRDFRTGTDYPPSYSSVERTLRTFSPLRVRFHRLWS